MKRTTPPTPAPTQPAPSAPRTRTWWAAMLGGALLALLGALALWSWFRAGPGLPEFPLTPLSSSPYLNTSPDAKYIGSARCQSCHGDRHASFRRTGMGRSMADVGLAREPDDGSFDHEKSGRRYQAVRRGGQMWHRELLLTSEGKEVLLQEHPVRYVIGSGRHSLTYAVVADGFLVESPLTWYASKKAWAISPGYDVPHPPGFERPVGEGCLTCHAGDARPLDGSMHKMRVHEAAIGCERCHGPGSLHVERHAGHTPGQPVVSSGNTDFTIVNPSRLSRELAESICQQCHLRSSATILTRGRQISDFRPGLPLEDFRQDFSLKAGDAPMTVVGHVEQMHLSRCYQKSDTLTCLTCHDPHNEPDDRRRPRHYRAACLKCHKPEACKVPVAERHEKSRQDSCIVCHMPSAPTEIPHIAFTHHRIGLHKQAKRQRRAWRGTLEPFFPAARFAEIDRKRTLGLGYLELSHSVGGPDLAELYRGQGKELLQEARSAGLRDPAVETALARLSSGRLPEARALAESALELPGIEAKDRCSALSLLARAQIEKGEHAEALATLKQLVQLRRLSGDWQLMARCQEALGRRDEQIRCFIKATRINPRLWQVHRYLADHFKQRDDQTQADWHRERAVP